MKNKIKLILAASLLSVAAASAQTGGVGVGTTTPDASSALDVTSTTKGFLMPRMTTTERTAITSPATGLQVYDTDTNSTWLYNGTVWVQGATSATDNTNDSWVDNAGNTVLSSGNVGIGTTTPDQKLTVDGQLKLLRSPARGNNVKIFAGDQQVFVSGASRSNYYSGSSHSFNAYTDATYTTTEHVFSFGLGKAYMFTPGLDTWKIDTDLKFTIDVDGVSNNKLGFSLSKTNTNPGTSNDDVYFGVTEAGNVGIGARVPTEKLEVNGAIKIGSTSAATPTAGTIRYNSGLQFHDGTTWNTVGTSATASKWTNDAINAKVTLTNLSDGVTARPARKEFVITDSGKVGIGSNSPSWDLQVTGAVDGDIAAIPGSLGGKPTIRAINFQGKQTQITTTDGTATVPINGVTSANLSMLYSNADNLLIRQATPTGKIYFSTNGEVRQTILDNGNVGIGTTTPTSKLQVVGLPVYVDNAAAVTAGLTAGAFYHSGDGIVRVVY